MKKLLTLCAAVLMAFAVTGSAMAEPATTVYVEFSKTTTYPFDGDPIRVRATALDATGNLATTYAGKPIADAAIIVQSLNFGSDVAVADESYLEVLDFSLSGSGATIDLDGAWREFAVSYDRIEEIGNDILKITLKQGLETLPSTQAIEILAPPANCYVVRTGGIAAADLPEVLEPIPAPQENKGLTKRAGESIAVDVFAAYGTDSDDPDDLIDTFIYTNNLPVGAEEVTISGAASATVTLENGRKATSIKVEKLSIPSALIGGADGVAQLGTMSTIFSYGKQSIWSAASKIIPEIGTECDDVNGDGQINLCSAKTFGNCDELTSTFAPAIFVAEGIGAATVAINKDTTLIKPDKVSKVTIVGLPVTTAPPFTGNWAGYFDVYGSFSPLDAYLYLTDWTQKPGSFKVANDGGPAQAWGAIVGFDSYGNPAPWTESTTTVQFILNTTGGADPGALISAPGYDGTSIISQVVPFQAFHPFSSPSINDLHLGIVPGSDLSTTAIANVDSDIEGVDFVVQDFVDEFPLGGSAIPAITVEAGKDSVKIAIDGTDDENSFSMRVVKQNGGAIKVNKEDQTTGLDAVSIPTKDADEATAEEDVVFFNTVDSRQLHLIFTGDARKTIFAYKTVNAIVKPADPGDFPPSAVSCSITKAAAIIDSEESHDEIAICQFNVTDAFGNSYKFGVSGNSVFLEDSDATVAVFKADETTPYPGADAEIDDNNVIVSIDPEGLPADAGTAVVKVTTGSASAKMNLDVRALQQTMLASKFVPILGINDTPVQVNFGDQNGKFIAPVILANCDPQEIEVELEAVDGSFAGVAAKFNLTTEAPFKIFTIKTDTGKTKMSLTADADPSKVTKEFDFGGFDSILPTVGAATVNGCVISIAVIDDKGLKLTASTVVVKNGTTGDVIPPDQYEVTYTGDGTIAGTIDVKVGAKGSYVLDIVAYDKFNNASTLATRTATVIVDGCDIGPSIDINPKIAFKAEFPLDITITGTNTSFSAASVVSFSCTGVTGIIKTVTSATELVVTVTLAADAAFPLTCDVTVDGATCPGCLVINADEPACITLEPSLAKYGDTNKEVTLTVEGVDLTGATDVVVSFGCTGVTVNSATVNSATTIVANIDVAEDAPDGTCDVTIKSSRVPSVGLICTPQFTVEGKPPCTKITVNPTEVRTGIVFGRNLTITITGDAGCDFAGATVDIEDMDTTETGTGNTLTVKAQTKGRLFGGTGAKTVTVTPVDGAPLTATITVKGLIF